MKPHVLSLVALVLSWAVASRAAAGPLQDVEDTASHPEPEHREPSRRSSGSSSQASRHRGDSAAQTAAAGQDNGAFAKFLAYVFLSPWMLPHALVDDPCASRFAAYPYDEAQGQLRLWREQAGCAARGPASGRRFAMQTALEGSYVLPSIAAGSIGARLQLPRRIEFLARMTLWDDRRARPREQALGATAHLAVRFAQSRRLDFCTGLGVRVFDLNKALYGLDLLYALDVYGRRPFMAHIELHAGTLDKALSAQARITLGVQLWKLELYAGYDHTVFVRDAHKTRLGGPVLGLRAWF